MRGKALALQVGLATASVALAALVTECSLGLLRPQDRSVWAHTRDGLVLHPASIETYSPRFGQVVRTNAFGLRDRERTLEKADGSFRVLILGDSFMEALQVAYEESLPGLLETALTQRSGGTVEVWNGSVSGWGTDDEIAYLERYGLRFRPDLVLIVMTLHNDVSDNLAFEHHELRDGTLAPRPPTQIGPFEWALIRARDSIANRSHLYSVYRRLKTVRRSREDASVLDAHVASLVSRAPDASTDVGWEVTRQLLERGQRLAEQSGARFAVALIPLGIQVSSSWREEFLTAHRLREQDIEIDRPQRLVAEWGARTGVPVIDLLPAFREAARQGASLYLEEDGHWSAAGHALADDVLARELLARGLVAPRPIQSQR